MSDSDGGAIVFDIRSSWEGISNPVEVASRHVGAALIQYCKVTKIPLPKGAGKSLAASGDNLALDIRSGGAEGHSLTSLGPDRV